MRPKPSGCCHGQLKLLPLLFVLLTRVTGVDAQVGDISQVSYPEWIPSDRVSPTYTVTVTYSPTQLLWTYRYTVANGSSAEQALQDLVLRFNGPSQSVSQPPGWSGMDFSPPASVPGAWFGATLPDSYSGTTAEAPGAARIFPGHQLEGFVVTSAYPPGYARTYAQGFAAYPVGPAGVYSDDINAPDDTTNAQRGFALGPIRYNQMTTGGDRHPGTDGFLGFMNMNDTGSVFLDPAPIALKFSLKGETVFRETLHITLNGVDVTTAFLPGPSGAAHLVGVFTVGSSPLRIGKNVLQTSVEGLKVGTTQRAADVDRMTFTVDPAVQSGAAVENVIVIGHATWECP
jgi:hypothetical protein